MFLHSMASSMASSMVSSMQSIMCDIPTKGGPLAAPPLYIFYRSASHDALHAADHAAGHAAGHAVQNHVLKSHARFGHAQAMYWKLQCIQNPNVLNTSAQIGHADHVLKTAE